MRYGAEVVQPPLHKTLIDDDMDKQAQERFFRILKETYEATVNQEYISINEVMDHLKNELTPLYPECH